MTTVLLVVLVVSVVAAYLTWIAGRVDRLHARCDAAGAALDAALVRRAAAAERLATLTDVLTDDVAEEVDDAAASALESGPDDPEREVAENRLSRAIAASPMDPSDPWLDELRTCNGRVRMARQFYNDAVRDARTLRLKPVPRYLRLAGRRELPEYFEIDDRVL